MLQRPSLPHTPGPQTPASPPHNPHPVPRPLSLASPCRCLCLTARKPVAASIFATCKSAATATPSLCTRSAHDADPPRASPAVAPPQHGTQDPKTANPPCTSPIWRHPNTERMAPPPPARRNANMARRTPPRCHPQHGTQDCDRDKRPQQWRRRWSSSGDGDGGGQWDGSGSDGSDGEALLLP